MRLNRVSFAGAAIALALFTWGCGGSPSGGNGGPPPNSISVSISPTSALVNVGGTQPFTATVGSTGSGVVSLSWSVNGVVNGNSSVGTISASGDKATYTAPQSIPTPNPVTVTVTATQGSAQASASAAVTITTPPPPIKMQKVSVAPGQTTGGVNVDVGSLAPKLVLDGIGLGNQTSGPGVKVLPGNGANLFIVGQGVTAGTVYEVSGTGVQVTQPTSSSFCMTTDNIPCVNVEIMVSANATPGPRNLLVLNSAGELSVLVGAIQIGGGL